MKNWTFVSMNNRHSIIVIAHPWLIVCYDPLNGRTADNSACCHVIRVRLPILELTDLLAAFSNSLKAIGTHSGTRIGGQIFPRRAPTWRSKNSISFSTKAPVGRSKASMLLCPAPSTQNGFALQGCGRAMNRSSPCQNGTTSSCVPCTINTGHWI